jgi:glutamate-5-semialdehyde dehydrogenase
MAATVAPGTATVTEICAAAKGASRHLATIDARTKNRALRAIADALDVRTTEILEANRHDLETGRASGLSRVLMDRLALDARRIAVMADGVRTIAALHDPVGEVIDGHRLPNGLDVRKVRVPLGVVAVVYEARPNVTIDAAALCLKSGNAIVLRGSSSAAHSNAVLAQIASDAAVEAGMPEGTISLIGGGDRAELAELATQTGLVDLIIPRGGEGLKEALKGVATVPVIYAASGNCHVYVDADANLREAQEIVINAKVQRPGVCNAAETLLVHRHVAASFLPRVLHALHDAGVVLHGDDNVREIVHELDIRLATEHDWDTEYLGLEMAVAVVDSVQEAVAHINAHGSGHSVIYVNASTRFTDGGEFGMGAEIGNSTQKLHARGPIGVRELCTFKYLVEGAGHVRP